MKIEMKKNTLITILATLVILCGMPSDVFAWEDGHGNDADARARAHAAAIGGSMVSRNTFRSFVHMPNSADTVLDTPNRFTTNGPGLAERAGAYGKLFADLCEGNIIVNLLESSRAKPVSEETDFGIMLWQPYGDYYQADIPSKKTYLANFDRPITNVAEEFGRTSPEITHYCLGQIAARTPYDQNIQDVTLQETLVAEALRFAGKTISGFNEVTPVILYDSAAYYEGVTAKGNGISITPQASGGPGVSVAAGSMFSWQQNKGMVSPSYGTGLKIIFLARAPNPTEGHRIAAEIQKINAELYESMRNERERESAAEAEWIRREEKIGGSITETQRFGYITKQQTKQTVQREKTVLHRKKVQTRETARPHKPAIKFTEIR